MAAAAGERVRGQKCPNQPLLAPTCRNRGRLPLETGGRGGGGHQPKQSFLRAEPLGPWGCKRQIDLTLPFAFICIRRAKLKAKLKLKSENRFTGFKWGPAK